MDLDALADGFADIAAEAGRVILGFYEGACAAWEKPDASPLTEADEAAERVVLARLAALLPGVPIVAEEAVARGDPLPALGARFVLVDPLDGTREFLARNGEFTVNIALVENGTPAAGVVHVPVTGALYVAGRTARKAVLGPGEPFRPALAVPIATRPLPDAGFTVAESRSHPSPPTGRFIDTLPVAGRIVAGSALKFGLLAEGLADVYPRFGDTMEWDVAAGLAVLRAAGGEVLTPEGSAFPYGKPGFRNGPFVAWGRPPQRAG
jgi:3'(2'), 5'-bisphosphate nucleotidase